MCDALQIEYKPTPFFPVAGYVSYFSRLAAFINVNCRLVFILGRFLELEFYTMNGFFYAENTPTQAQYTVLMQIEAAYHVYWCVNEMSLHSGAGESCINHNTLISF